MIEFGDRAPIDLTLLGVGIDKQEHEVPSQISRRSILSLAAVGLAAGLLGGCGNASNPDVAITREPSLAPAETTSATIYTPLVGPDMSRIDADEMSYGEVRPSGLLDAEKLVAGGIAFQIMKASRGHLDTQNFTWREPNFKEGRQRAADAGLLPGAYHFLEEGNPEMQAESFVQRLGETGGQKGIMHFVDFENYVGNGTPGSKRKYYPTYDDLTAFAAKHYELTQMPLGIYTANYYWGDKNRKVVGKDIDLVNENTSVYDDNPAIPNTYLWWCRLMSSNPKAHAVDFVKNVATPADKEDPWNTESLGGYKYPTFRQVTFNGLLLQFDGSKYSAGHANKNKILDMNVSFRPYDELLSLAALPAGALPTPKPVTI